MCTHRGHAHREHAQCVTSCTAASCGARLQVSVPVHGCCRIASAGAATASATTESADAATASATTESAGATTESAGAKTASLFQKVSNLKYLCILHYSDTAFTIYFHKMGPGEDDKTE
ncbi:hypothetical protein NDU88_007193 [Pleurodeles waltl]|uniref:Uncharacterized protein n=1 Tax=Pleurodeles waltl TaxID=8319 RepID=A0AAV7MI21_PLEWA|nr:hypothetical protein NDU88_007193 [Pleurodeles waltl]